MAQNDTVRVIYHVDGATVLVENDSISLSVDGAYVSITSLTSKEHEITLILSGESSDGALLFTGGCKATVVFNGLRLKSNRGAAIDIEDGKRINLVLADGTANVLEDVPDGNQKACLYVKGHAEIRDGSGSLHITGNTKHAFAAKEYIELKAGCGEIIVGDCVADGLHSGEYLLMKGGRIDILRAGDDGVSADLDMTIDGGSISAECPVSGGKALKSDQNINISGGSLNLLTTGDSAIVIKDGVPDSVKCACIRAKGDLNVSGGVLQLKSTGLLGRCINVDGLTTISADANITMETAAGEGLQSDAGFVMDGGIITAHCYDDCINSAANVTINGGQLYALSTANDAIDSNLRKQGAVGIHGGVFLAMSLAPAHEEGIDCNRKRIVVSGGYLFSCGKRQETRFMKYQVNVDAQQPVALLDGLKLTENAYYTLTSSGIPLFTIRMPGSVEDDVSLLSAPGLLAGSQCSLERSRKAPATAEYCYFDCLWTKPVLDETTTVRTWTQADAYYNELENGASSIPQIADGVTAHKETIIYNLAGQRLSQVQQGVNIVNGRKIFLK